MMSQSTGSSPTRRICYLLLASALGFLLLEFAYRRIFIDIVPMLSRTSGSGTALISSADPGGPLFRLEAEANRSAISMGVHPRGMSSFAIIAANGRQVIGLSSDRDGTPSFLFEDPNTGMTVFEITVLPDGSAEIYAPKGLTIVETPRGRDAEQLSPMMDEDQPEDG